MGNKTLYVFDMDDTLVNTPSMVDVLFIDNGNVKSGIKFFDKIFSELLELMERASAEDNTEKKRGMELAGIPSKLYFKRVGPDICVFSGGEPIDIEFLYKIRDSKNITTFEKKKVLERLEVSDDRKIKIGVFNEFYTTEATVGVKINKAVVDLYHRVENKMILTGRNISIYKGVSYILFTVLGIDEPNYGLKLYNGSSGVRNFKASEILKAIEQNKWEKIVYIDDREDWMEFAAYKVKELFPSVEVETINPKNL